MVEGPGAVERVQRHFRPAGGRALRDCDPDRLVYGRFGPPPGEEIIVRCRSPEAVELHSHGGSAAVARLLRVLGEENCAALDWRAWVQAHNADPIVAAAHVALADARTERTAAILLDQYNGALRRAITEVQNTLLAGDVVLAGQLVDLLLARADIGRHLVRPWRVVVAGEPNVGKSSLINALLGYQRTIVHPTPGTTRDVVTATTAVAGWPVELRDTAGLGEGGHPLEQAGVELARRELESADLLLLVFDLGRRWSPAAGVLCADWPAALVVHNKSDLAAAGPRPPGITVSALTDQEAAPVWEAILARLVPSPPAVGAAVPFTGAQVGSLQAAAAALTRGDCRAALAGLAE